MIQNGDRLPAHEQKHLARLLRYLDLCGIDPGEACRAAVKPWPPGNFIAPDDAGFTYFMVEDRGEPVRLAHARTLAPIAWAFAADADMQRADLSGRIGMTVSAAPDATPLS